MARATTAEVTVRVVTTMMVCGVVLGGACKAPVDPNAIKEPWTDKFERPALGPDWKDTSNGKFMVKDGALHGADAFNHPVWLDKVLPRDVRIELDIWTTSPEGDIKVEVFGDGRSYDPDGKSYLATSYVCVMGGWKNSQSKIARRDEHRNQDPARTDVKVVPNQKYHWVIERRGNKLDWSVDGQPFLSMLDDDPLFGPGHDHFGVGNWQSPVYLDNLTITPL